jgi:formylglycine-generating enzyme required for sulfatase activity
VPRHRVRITKPFYMGIHEVTVGQFREFVADAGYRTQTEQDGKGGFGYDGKSWSVKREHSWRNTGVPQADNQAVFNISWDDAAAFCRWLSRKEGQSFRLPTEAEWEYACRAGSSTRYYFGDSDAMLGNHAWFDKNCGDSCVHSVGQKLPNPWSLFDVYGNVCEWCDDWYCNDYYSKSPVDDPHGPDYGYDTNNITGPGHVIRGISTYSSSVTRSAYRTSQKPDRMSPFATGFRVCLVLADKPAGRAPMPAR